MDVDTSQFDSLLDQLMNELTKHMKDECDIDLPQLEKELGADSDSLAKSFERTKMFVPTRSHPWAPDKPPFETVVGLMTAPLDKLQDIFRSFPS